MSVSNCSLPILHDVFGEATLILSISTTFTGKEQEVQALEKGGNEVVNAIFEARLLNGHGKIPAEADPAVRGNYIRQKYEELKFYTAPPATLIKHQSTPDISKTSDIGRTSSMPWFGSTRWEADDTSRQVSGKVGNGKFLPMPGKVARKRLERARSLDDTPGSDEKKEPEIHQTLSKSSSLRRARESRPKGDKTATGFPASSCQQLPMRGSKEQYRRSDSSNQDAIPVSTADQARHPEQNEDYTQVPEITVPDLTPPFLAENSERNELQRSDEPLLVDVRGLKPPSRSLSLKSLVHHQSDKLGGGQRRSQRASISGSSPVKSSSPFNLPKARDTDNSATAIGGRLRSRRASISGSMAIESSLQPVSKRNLLNSQEANTGDKPTGSNGERRRSRKTVIGGSMAVESSPTMLPISSVPNATAPDRKMKRRASLRDTVNEIVQILEKEDKNHQVSERTNRRMVERRSSLKDLSQPQGRHEAKPPAAPVSKEVLAETIKKFLGHLMSPEEQRAALAKLGMKCMNGRKSADMFLADKSPAPTERTCMLSTAFGQDLRTAQQSGTKRPTQLSRRSSLPSLASARSGGKAELPPRKTSTPRKSRSLRSKLEKTLSVSRPSCDDQSAASEHSDILSTTDGSDGSTMMVRVHSVPDLSKEQPPGQLSCFLGALMGETPTSRPLDRRPRAPQHRLTQGRRRSKQRSRLAAGDDVTVDSDIRSTE